MTLVIDLHSECSVIPRRLSHKQSRNLLSGILAHTTTYIQDPKNGHLPWAFGFQSPLAHIEHQDFIPQRTHLLLFK